MCSPAAILVMQGVSSGMQAIGAYNQANATKAALNYQADASDNNAVLDELQAKDSLYRGQVSEQDSDLRTAALKSTQRTDMAANGLDLSQGTPVNILTSTDVIGEHDAMTIRDNAMRQAWGYRVNEQNDRYNATLLRYQADTINPKTAALTTLLGNAGTMGNTMAGMSKAGVT